MGSVSLTGNDAISISGRNLNDLADGNFVELVFPEDITMVKASKNGNILYALANSGFIVDLIIRLLKGSSDDKYLNSLMQGQFADFSTFNLIEGVFSKRVGDGNGNISTVVYQCQGGVFRRQVDAKTNAEGDVEQSVSIWRMKFGNGSMSIQ